MSFNSLVGATGLVYPGRILQVLSTTKVDTFTTTSTSLVDVTGLSVSITPSSASNLVLVTVCLSFSNNTTNGISRGSILRGATAIGGGTAASLRPSGSFVAASPGTASAFGPQTMMFLDSPATTSATTYKAQIAAESGTTAQVGLGRFDDSDAAKNPRLSSSITVMEISA